MLKERKKKMYICAKIISALNNANRVRKTPINEAGLFSLRAGGGRNGLETASHHKHFHFNR